MAVVKDRDGFRTCNKCSVEKPLDLNNYRTTRDGNGKDYFRRGCKECEKGYWEARNKRKWQQQKIKIQELRDSLVEYAGGKCAICKKKYSTCVYDFHHIDPETKSYNISTMIGSFGSAEKEEDLHNEVDKCLLLCSNCHRELHWGDKNSRD